MVVRVVILVAVRSPLKNVAAMQRAPRAGFDSVALAAHEDGLYQRMHRCF